MPRERVTVPTEPTRGVCDGPHCGRPILWVMTVGGSRMPLDPDVSPDGCGARGPERGQVIWIQFGGDEMSGGGGN